MTLENYPKNNFRESVNFQNVCQSEEKRRVIECCDSAFPKGLTIRDNYEEIFEKIDRYAEFFAAYHGEAIAGYAAMYANNDREKIAYITMIGVKEEFQRHHIGSGLIEKCIERARENGMTKIRLEVLNTNEKAILFYKRYHFHVEKVCSSESMYMLLTL